jgi:uncharacterized protein YjbJ (UPF0337 family)
MSPTFDPESWLPAGALEFGASRAVFAVRAHRSLTWIIISRNRRRKLPVYDLNQHRDRKAKMDKDRIAGGAKKVTGAIKEGVGRATGDRQTEAEGRAEKAAGRVQSAVGKTKDAAREILNKK